MKRWPVAVVAAVGVVGGAVAGLATDAPPALVPIPTPPVATVAIDTAGPLLVWTSGGLPDGLAPQVNALSGVRAVTEVTGGNVDLPLADGWSVPLDVIGIDAETYDHFVPEGDRFMISGVAGPRALVGSTSARFHGLRPGDTLALAGGAVTVDGVVDDTAVGAAEVVLSKSAAAARGVTVARYLLVDFTADRSAIEAAIRRLLPARARVRFRTPGQTPFLREGDAVLPQALIKERFGEFAYRPGAGRDIEQDPAWVAENIVTATVPLLGRVRCHRNLIAQVTAAMERLEAEGLGYLVDRSGFAGCWAPRRVGPGLGVSRHAWGAALDINVTTNPTGTASAQDARLVALMKEFGFTSGAEWLVPDPAHFEYVSPPA